MRAGVHMADKNDRTLEEIINAEWKKPVGKPAGKAGSLKKAATKNSQTVTKTGRSAAVKRARARSENGRGLGSRRSTSRKRNSGAGRTSDGGFRPVRLWQGAFAGVAANARKGKGRGRVRSMGGNLRRLGSGKASRMRQVRGKGSSLRKGGLGKGRKGRGKDWGPRDGPPARWGSGGDKGGRKGGGKGKIGGKRDRYMFADDLKGGKGKSKGRVGKGRKGKGPSYDDFGRKGGSKGRSKGKDRDRDRELPGVWRHDLWEVVADNFGRKRGLGLDSFRGKGAGEKRRRSLRV